MELTANNWFVCLQLQWHYIVITQLNITIDIVGTRSTVSEVQWNINTTESAVSVCVQRLHK